MNFTLDEDQASVLSGLDQLIASIPHVGGDHAATCHWSEALDHALAVGGFLDIARVDGFGLLEAALVVQRVAHEPHLAEAGASALIGPMLPIEGVRPIALVTGAADQPARFLPMARMLVIDRGNDALLLPMEPAMVEPVETLLGYPYGRLRDPDLSRATVIADAASIRRRWRLAIACEAAGCMASALAAVIDYVTTRQAFGRPIAAFQAIQHRLAMATETAESTRWLALRAAWSDAPADAAIAAGFAQDRIARFTYDMHQFCGAMGLTLEFPLHLWTYRLRALAGELGGANAQARQAATATWGQAA